MEKKIITHLCKNDDHLKGIISQIEFPVIESSRNVFHDLMSCIIEQQIHYRSTKKTFQKLLNLTSIKTLSVNNFSIFEEKALKNTKLSTQKYETILRIIDFFKQQNIDWKKKNEKEVRDILSQIKGVGNWTIDMILLYTLEKPNIFPADDYHLKLMMTKMYKIDTSARVKAQLKAVAKNWSPYQSFGVKYLLAWKAFQKKVAKS